MTTTYPVTDTAPPFGVKVKGLLPDGFHDCARVYDQRRQVVVWYVKRNGTTERFVEEGGSFGSSVIACWRPKNPTAWKAPLPPPVIAQPDVQWAQPIAAPEPLEKEPDQWWRIANAVKVSTVGLITPREVEGRIMRAVMTEHSFAAADTIIERSTLTWLARMIELQEMIEGKRPTYWNDRFIPSARDLSDFPRMIPWLTAVAMHSERYASILRMRGSHPAWTFTQIAKELGGGRNKAASDYGRAVLFATKVANDVRTKEVAIARRKMAELREARR
ncbi:MAG: hypothetical protein ABL901_02780 [Hyphomicrobiaceae bacterium]|nr:hypothetical protein [Hyphomicrobiaceae bacterium]